MDRFGSFDRESELDAASATDAGVEAPPAIGSDERRMHVRAYNYWVSMLDGRAYPSIEDLEPEKLEDFGPHSVLLDFSGGITSPGITYLGGKLRTECNLPDDVASIADVPSRSLLSRLTDHYMQIIANRAPIGFEAEFVNERGNNTAYRGILMPFSSDDDTIDFIYGVINWKEVADAALAADLTVEVDQALQSAPARPADPVVVWADGPSASITEPETDSDVLELTIFSPDGSEGLGDWLAAARDSATIARQADGRSRSALYRALGQAYDFALVAADCPDDYVQLLEDSGIKAQDRAPMTPVVKLVFGFDYDKTRLAEFASALTYANRYGIKSGEFGAVLESYSGGLKALVAAERAERRPERKIQTAEADFTRVRALPAMAEIDLPGDAEFVLLVARRVDAGKVAVIGSAGHDTALLNRLLRAL